MPPEASRATKQLSSEEEEKALVEEKTTTITDEYP